MRERGADGGPDAERDRLITAAALCGPGDLIGHRAVEELLRRGYPDALWIPPEALEAYREATSAPSRRRLWKIGVVVAVLFSTGTAALGGVTFKAGPPRPPPPPSTYTFICGLRGHPVENENAPWAEHTRRIRVRWEDR